MMYHMWLHLLLLPLAGVRANDHNIKFHVGTDGGLDQLKEVEAWKWQHLSGQSLPPLIRRATHALGTVPLLPSSGLAPLIDSSDQTALSLVSRDRHTSSSRGFCLSGPSIHDQGWEYSSSTTGAGKFKTDAQMEASPSCFNYKTNAQCRAMCDNDPQCVAASNYQSNNGCTCNTWKKKPKEPLVGCHPCGPNRHKYDNSNKCSWYYEKPTTTISTTSTTTTTTTTTSTTTTNSTKKSNACLEQQTAGGPVGILFCALVILYHQGVAGP